MTATSVVARPMLAGMFVFGGVEALRDPKSRVLPAEKVAPAIARQLGLPEDTELLVRINGGAQVAAGLMLATGKLPRVASLVLAGSLVPTTLAAHRFWEETDPSKRHAQQIQFLKNAAMLGGLLLAAADTGGRPSITWRAKRKARQGRRAARRAKAQAAKAAGAAGAAVDAAQAVTKGVGKVSKSGAGLAASAAAPAAQLVRTAAGSVPELTRTAANVGSTLRDRVDGADVAAMLHDVAAGLHDLGGALQAMGREAAETFAPRAREVVAVAAPKAREAVAAAAPKAREAVAAAAPKAREAVGAAAPKAKDAVAVAKGALANLGHDGDGVLAALHR